MTQKKSNSIIEAINAPQKYFKYLVLFGFFSTLTLAFSYLLLLNSLATRGFHLEAVKAERLALIKTSEALDIEMAIPNSLYALESNETFQNMETVRKKYYITIPPQEESVAFLPKNTTPRIQ